MVNGTKPATAKQVVAIQQMLGQGVYGSDLSFDEAQALITDKRAQQALLRDVLTAWKLKRLINPYVEEQAWCLNFLQGAGVLTTGLDEAVVPERPSGTAWLIPLPAGVGCNHIFDNLWNFAKWRWTDDLDGQLAKQDLSARWIWVEPNLPDLEPDKATLGQSANQADPEQQSIQLREGMMFYAVAYQKTGRVPDKKGYTLCGGSRYRDGNVPRLYLNDNGEAYVDRYGPDKAVGAHGVRQAVR
ncbi:MAG: hypothetical protein KIH67_002495 [Candidatus Moranbacteria bacterium]|nr:hypothetical protein [Candidatus Moranbacteria bacterium]